VLLKIFRSLWPAHSFLEGHMFFSPGVDHVKTLVKLNYDLRKVYEAVRDRNRES
jgi:hypothetical protein